MKTAAEDGLTLCCLSRCNCCNYGLMSFLVLPIGPSLSLGHRYFLITLYNLAYSSFWDIFDKKESQINFLNNNFFFLQNFCFITLFQQCYFIIWLSDTRSTYIKSPFNYGKNSEQWQRWSLNIISF